MQIAQETNNIKIMFRRLDTDYFYNKSNTPLFASLVFKNFINLSNDKSLNHNLNEIYRLIKSPNFFGYFAKYNEKIVGYLLGEIIQLNDGRKVLYINYLFVSPYFRNSGIASYLLKYAISFAKNTGLDAVMLTCDTYNIKLHDFYFKRGFTIDNILAKYKRHDILSYHIGYY